MLFSFYAHHLRGCSPANSQHTEHLQMHGQDRKARIEGNAKGVLMAIISLCHSLASDSRLSYVVHVQSSVTMLLQGVACVACAPRAVLGGYARVSYASSDSRGILDTS